MRERYRLVVERSSSDGNDPTLVEGSWAVCCAALNELTKFSYTLEGLTKLTVEPIR